MAKQKLTKAAIGFIIEKRNDWNVNYTFNDIAKLLKEDFDIAITEQGVSKSYHKYKDDGKLQTLLAVAKNKNSSKARCSNDTTSDIPTNPIAIKKDRDFDENVGKDINFDEFFK